MLRTVMVKLLPPPKEKELLVRTLERLNKAATYAAKVAFEMQCFNGYTLQKYVYSDLRGKFGLSSQMAIRAIGQAVDSYKATDPKVRRERRSHMSKFRKRASFPYDPRILSFKDLDHASILTLEGRIRVPMLLGGYQKGMLTHPRRGEADLCWMSGEFYLAIVVETPVEPPYSPKGWLGVDMGVVNLAVDSDGNTYKGEKVDAVRLRTDELKGSLQRKGTQSAKKHLQRVRRREARFRRQENHCISKRLVSTAKDTGRGIALEDLSGISQRTTVRRGQRRRHLSWGFDQLRQFVEYKAEAQGVPVVLVDPRNTSRTCPQCGTVDKKNRPTQRDFQCVGCGLAGHADHNAAINIAVRAGVNRPIVAGSEETWGHVSDLSYKPPISIGGR
jgi:IS605 OrfB family transposase